MLRGYFKKGNSTAMLPDPWVAESYILILPSQNHNNNLLLKYFSISLHKDISNNLVN